MMETEQVCEMWVLNWPLTWLITCEDMNVTFIMDSASRVRPKKRQSQKRTLMQQQKHGKMVLPGDQNPSPKVLLCEWSVFIFLICYFYFQIILHTYLFKHYHLFHYACVWISVAWYFVIAWSYMIFVGWQFKLKCFNFHFADLHEIWILTALAKKIAVLWFTAPHSVVDTHWSWRLRQHILLRFR
jgi:hypothetical protein